VRRAWIGIAGQTIRLSRRRVQLSQLSSSGAVLVTEVTPRSPAADAGLKPRDIILRFADHAVNGVDDLQRLLTREHIDRAASITVMRDGAQRMLPIIPSEPRQET